ncbi:hypothetical protein GCM10023168_32010 [Fodinibacter luteus]|uniref:TrbL/VirB6 plasmid conjugal transfer protein n=1 Tax=Fodinibacter luteus TaxID=552064 RepID=A0ABP8KPI0_9MICO
MLVAIGIGMGLVGLGVVAAPVSSATPQGEVGTVRAHPGIPGIPDCKDAPVPEQPGTGLPGALDPAPDPLPVAGDPFVQQPSTSVYDQYGYAGLRWHTYDLGCGGSVRDPAAATDTMIGNVLLSCAVWLTAATNGLHNKVAHPASYMRPLDSVVETVTTRLHESIWSPWGAVAVLGVAAFLLYQAMRGLFPTVVAGAAWAALVLAVVAAITQYPSRASSFFDDTIASTIGSIQSRTAGIDASTQPGESSARAQGALTVDRVLYDAWLRGQLGSSDSAAAKRWGPTLFRASAVTWSESAAASTPEAMNQLNEEKGSQWKDTADEIAEQDPATYVVLQGKAGGRMGTGLMALFGAVFVDLFRLVADVFLLAGLVMLRLLVMFLPAAAVIGVFAPLSGVVKQMANIGGAAVVNVVAFSAGSVVYTAAISAVLSTADDIGMGIMALVLCLVITLAAFVLMAPLLSFTRILGHSGRRMRRHHLGRQLTRYVVTRQGVNDGTKKAIEDSQDDEPEPTVPADDGGRRAADAPPRAETFARAQVVWDVTSDGGLSRTSASPRSRVDPRVLTTQGVRPTSPDVRPEPRESALLREGSSDRRRRETPAPPGDRRAVVAPSGLVHAPQPAGGVLQGEVLTGSIHRVHQPAVVPAHDANAPLADDGIGYFVYDPRTGAMLHRRPGVDDLDSDAS